MDFRGSLFLFAVIASARSQYAEVQYFFSDTSCSATSQSDYLPSSSKGVCTNLPPNLVGTSSYKITHAKIELYTKPNCAGTANKTGTGATCLAIASSGISLKVASYDTKLPKEGVANILYTGSDASTSSCGTGYHNLVLSVSKIGTCYKLRSPMQFRTTINGVTTTTTGGSFKKFSRCGSGNYTFLDYSDASCTTRPSSTSNSTAYTYPYTSCAVSTQQGTTFARAQMCLNGFKATGIPVSGISKSPTISIATLIIAGVAVAML